LRRGVLRVRVTNIECNEGSREISAEIEEIPTRGLELCRQFFCGRPNEPSPLRWNIAAGYLTNFSDHARYAGYGGWSVYFAPEVVSRLVSVASDWPAELTAMERYILALDLLMDWRMGPDADAPPERVLHE
jgi:hypothetical protein